MLLVKQFIRKMFDIQPCIHLFQLKFSFELNLYQPWLCEGRRGWGDQKPLNWEDVSYWHIQMTWQWLQNADLHHVLQTNGVQAATPLLPYSSHSASLSHTHRQPEYKSKKDKIRANSYITHAPTMLDSAKQAWC